MCPAPTDAESTRMRLPMAAHHRPKRCKTANRCHLHDAQRRMSTGAMNFLAARATSFVVRTAARCMQRMGPTPEQLHERMLVTRCQTGDERAFVELVARY